MRKKLSVFLILGFALLFVFTSCEPRAKYKNYSFVIMDDATITVYENEGEVTLTVRAYPMDSDFPDVEVVFETTDGSGESGAVNGVDYTLVSPANGLLTFYGDSTATIKFRISDANVGIYTGRKNFTVKLTDATNGYTVGGAYSTIVYIADVDKNPDENNMPGTYTCAGLQYVTSVEVEEAEWEVIMYEHPYDPDLLYLDGIAPHYDPAWESDSTWQFAAYGYLQNEKTQLAIPSQVSDYWTGTYFTGWIACTSFNNGFMYSSRWPDITFTYSQSNDNWVSDYGIFLAAFTTTELDSFEGYYDACAPPMTLTRVD